MNKLNSKIQQLSGQTTIHTLPLDDVIIIEGDKPVIDLDMQVNNVEMDIEVQPNVAAIEMAALPNILAPDTYHKHVTYTKGITVLDSELIEDVPAEAKAAGYNYDSLSRAIKEVSTFSGGVTSMTLGELDNVEDVVDALEEGALLGVEGGMWTAVRKEFLESGTINGIQIKTVKDLIDYLYEYGFAYPEKNNPPKLTVKNPKFVFQTDEDPIFVVNIFDAEGGLLSIEGELPDSLGGGQFSVGNLGNGDIYLNLNHLVYGPTSDKRIEKGNYTLTNVVAVDALGRKSVPLTLNVIIGGIYLESTFDTNATYNLGETINMPFGIQSVYSSVKVYYEVGGYKFEMVDGELTEVQLASNNEEAEIVLTNNDVTNPNRFYMQDFALSAKNQSGRYTVNIYATSLDGTVKSNTIKLFAVCLDNSIIYVLNNIEARKQYLTNLTYNIPVSIYSQGKEEYQVVTYFERMEDDKTTTDYSTDKQVVLNKLFPEDESSYNLITYLNVKNNAKTLNRSVVTINVENPSQYAVLTQPKYKLDLYLSARGRNNVLNNVEIWDNKKTLSQEYNATMFNYIPRINGWEAMQGEDQLTGNCLYSSNGAYSIVNYRPFADYGSKGNNVNDGMTFELVVHNTDITSRDAYNFTISNVIGDKVKGITMNNEWMYIYYAEGKCIELPVACAKNHFTTDGEWVVGKDEYVHITVTYNNYRKEVIAYVNGCISAVGTYAKASDIQCDYDMIINGYRDAAGDIIANGDEKIKTIRVYQTALTADEVLNNYIADIIYDKDREHAIIVNDEDQPFLSRWNVKGNRYTMNKDDSAFLDTSFIPGKEKELYSHDLLSPLAAGDYGQAFMDWLKDHITEMTWQGNSSLAYPIKNYAIEDIIDPESTEGESKKFWMYQTQDKDGSFNYMYYPSDEFHLKTNYIDSSHANNQGIAKIADKVWKTPYNWSREDYVKYLGVDKPFPVYDVEGNKYSKYPIPVTRLAIDGVPFVMYAQNLDSANNLKDNLEFAGLYTWNLKQNEQMYGMAGYKADKFHKNTIWRSESNGDSVHPQLRSWSYGFFDGSKKSLKIDNLGRPLTDEYITSQGLIEGKDYTDLDKPANAAKRAEELKWRIGAEMVMDWECRNPKSLGTGVWEELKDGEWVEATSLVSDKDLGRGDADKTIRWRWTEVDEFNYPVRKKGKPSVNYWEDMLDYDTLIPNLGADAKSKLHPETRALVLANEETNGTPAIDKELGKVATKQHLDFIEAMRWCEESTDEAFANPLIFGKYFHLQSMCDYVIMCITFWLQDQLGRNLTMVQFDNREIDYADCALNGGIAPFYAMMYDMDTAFGTNVQGTLSNDPYAGWQYPIKGRVFGNLYTPAADGSDFTNYNCGESVLFRRFSALYGDMLVKRYKELRDGVRGLDNVVYEAPLTYNNILSLYQKEIAGRYGQRMYNKDAQYKYLGEDYDSQALIDEKRKYLMNARGNKLVFMKNFVKKRLEYVDSLFKYVSDSDSVGDMTYFQHRHQGLFELTIETDKPAYLRVSFAQNQESAIYCDGTQPTKVSYYYTGDSEKILRIYNSAKISKITGLANKSLTKAKLSSMSNVREINLSNNATLNELVITGCKALRNLNLSNVNPINGLDVDLSKNFNITHLDLHNSTINIEDYTMLPFLTYLNISNCTMPIINLNNVKTLKTFIYDGCNPEKMYLNNCGVAIDMLDGEAFDALKVLEADGSGVLRIGNFKNLETIILRNNPNLTTIGNMNGVALNSDFASNCPKLTSIAGIFEGSDVVNFSDFNGYFVNCPKLSNVSRIFKNCINLVGPITETLFDRFNITAMQEAFYGCVNLTGNVKEYWTIGGIQGKNAFKNCQKLDNYLDIPGEWGGRALVTLTVRDIVTNEVVSGVLVKDGDTELGLTNDNGVVTFLTANASANITASKALYVDRQETILVDGDTTAEIYIKPYSTMLISVRDGENGNAVADANVTINGVTAVTDANGGVTMQVYPNEATQCAITQTYYFDSTHVINTSTSGEVTIEVDRRPIWKIKVKDGRTSNGVEGASVIVAGETYTTDADGIISDFFTNEGPFTYVISKDGYTSTSGEVTLIYEGQVVIILSPKCSAIVTMQTANGPIMNYTLTALEDGRVYNSDSAGKITIHGDINEQYTFNSSFGDDVNAANDVHTIRFNNFTMNVNLTSKSYTVVKLSIQGDDEETGEMINLSGAAVRCFVDDAWVNIGNTNSEGAITFFNKVQGDVLFDVKKSGYRTYEGTYTSALNNSADNVVAVDITTNSTPQPIVFEVDTTLENSLDVSWSWDLGDVYQLTTDIDFVYSVDWGDGVIDEVNTKSRLRCEEKEPIGVLHTHTYATHGTYEVNVLITGMTKSNTKYGFSLLTSNNISKLTSLSSLAVYEFGSNMHYSRKGNMFKCPNATVIGGELLDNVYLRSVGYNAYILRDLFYELYKVHTIEDNFLLNRDKSRCGGRFDNYGSKLIFKDTFNRAFALVNFPVDIMFRLCDIVYGYDSSGRQYDNVYVCSFNGFFAKNMITQDNIKPMIDALGRSERTEYELIDTFNSIVIDEVPYGLLDSINLRSIERLFSTTTINSVDCLFSDNCKQTIELLNAYSLFNNSYVKHVGDVFRGLRKSGGRINTITAMFKSSGVEDIHEDIFYGVLNLNSKFELSELLSFSQDLSHLPHLFKETIKVNDLTSMMYGCRGLITIDDNFFTNLTFTKNDTSANQLLRECISISKIPDSIVNVTSSPQVRFMNYMFSGVKCFPDVFDFSTLGLSARTLVCEIMGMLMYTNIKHITNFNFENDVFVTGIFQSCEQLERIEGRPFDNDRIKLCDNMLYNCSALDMTIDELGNTPPWTRGVRCESFAVNTSNKFRYSVPVEYNGVNLGGLHTNNPTINVKVFKDNEWFLNQNVVANGVLLTQMSDGSYRGTIPTNGYITIDVNNGEHTQSDYYPCGDTDVINIMLGDTSVIQPTFDLTTMGDVSVNDIIMGQGDYNKVFEYVEGVGLRTLTNPPKIFFTINFNFPNWQANRIGATYHYINHIKNAWYLGDEFREVANKNNNGVGQGTMTTNTHRFTTYYENNPYDGESEFIITKIVYKPNYPALPANFLGENTQRINELEAKIDLLMSMMNK